MAPASKYMVSLVKFLQAKLSATGDAAWKEREAAVLALGAIAEGCINGLYPHLSEVILFWIAMFYGAHAYTCTHGQIVLNPRCVYSCS